MTKKLRRKVDFVFGDDGAVNRPVRAGILGGAILTMDDGHVAEDRIFIHTDHFYTKRALDELIAELLFLKQEWEEHPVYADEQALEQEQAEDMEEIGLREAEEFHADPNMIQEDEAGDLPEDIWDEPLHQQVQENPFERNAQEIQREHQQRMEEILRQVQRQRHNIPR